MACLILFLSYALSFIRVVYGAPQVPCLFTFGDSLADTGNNNNLKTTAKANFPPYGIDFPGGPTGRFTNGRTFADILGELLGFTDYPPPYVTSEGKDVRMGVNYASGGSGILPETGKNLGEVFSFDAQLTNHNVTISRINDAEGNDQNAPFLNKCIYLVGFGSNDYINNYMMPQVFPASRLYKPDQFAEILIGRYTTQLTNLYNLGARKIALFGLATIGCSPAIVSMAPDKSASGCVDKATLAIKEFNDRLKPLVDNLNKDLMGAHFVYVNSTNIAMANTELNEVLQVVFYTLQFHVAKHQSRMERALQMRHRALIEVHMCSSTHFIHPRKLGELTPFIGAQLAPGAGAGAGAAGIARAGAGVGVGATGLFQFSKILRVSFTLFLAAKCSCS
ncbi:GDSL-lipase 1 [Heracleum sosnowskyi]|uniref:GDSL-lipase 1 n=1 Tax=Heracleum sosnowskyi TaxID=360622 RepID=A0AAD8MR78_9APIA|nr:GDSL-lipase 1 [Heracleum sosnowskyi]